MIKKTASYDLQSPCAPQARHAPHALQTFCAPEPRRDPQTHQAPEACLAPRPRRTAPSFLILFLIVFSALPLLARAGEAGQTLDDLKKAAPKVFIDCGQCDIDFIRTEIPFVNYVWDPKEATVHVLVTEQRTGGGGSEYTMAFIGLESCADLKSELKYYSGQTDTEDDVRRGMVQIMKLGLAPFVARTPIARLMEMSLGQRVSSTAVEDPWDFWVFNVSLRAQLNGEKSTKTNQLNGNLSINRVTPESKLRLGLSASKVENKFDYEGTRITSTSDQKVFDGIYVKSIGEHWSIGGYVDVHSSTYSNIAYGYAFLPAIEFNVFPYSESTRRQFRFYYRVGYSYHKYYDESIYDRMSDGNFNQALIVTFEAAEPWGGAEVSVEGSHHLNNFKRNRLRLSGELFLRIFRGLALSMEGRYSAIHDQINLRKGTATLDELLLRRRELASNYSYSFQVGLSYSFGSIFSNVVNPRFGN